MKVRYVMSRRNGLTLEVGLLAAFAIMFLVGCTSRFPVTRGHMLSARVSDRPLGAADDGFDSALQIHWFGTACYLIRLGNTAIFVDPYLTYQNMGRVLFGQLASDPRLVRNTIAPLPVPQAIFVSHSDYDHLLDIAEVHRQPGWQQVPIYGSRTTHNILCGYGEELAAFCHESVCDGEWHIAGKGVRYQAIHATHAPQIPGIRLYTGQVTVPRTTPPRRAADFKGGDTFAYLFELSNGPAKYLIYMTAAPSDAPAGLPSGGVAPVDVAILCVADWMLADGYPDAIIRSVQARQIVASHFDDFLLLSGHKRAQIPYADVNDFVHHIQQMNCRPQVICVPDVDSVVVVDRYCVNMSGP